MTDRPATVMSGVTVVVPHWNKRELLAHLLERLRCQTYPIYETIVVDNGSTDGSAGLARDMGARVVALERNAGFSGAVNRGIQETRTEWIAILNNDVEPAPDWLERLVRVLDQPRVWYVTGKLLDAASPECLDGTYDTLCRGGCAWRAGHGRRDGPVWAHPRRIWLVPFTAALFRAELFRRAGALDERFGSYLEDVDFSLRCAAQGYSGMYVPDAAARHIGSATLGAWHKETVRLIARNQVLLVAKHYPAGELWRCAWPVAVAQSLWGLVAVWHGRGLAWCRGKLEGLALFRSVRRGAGILQGRRPFTLPRIVEQSEAELFRLQRRTGFDWYWRIYFALTSLT